MGQRIAASSSSPWEGAAPRPGDTVPGFAAPCCGAGPGTLLLPWLCLTSRSGPGKAGSAGGKKEQGYFHVLDSSLCWRSRCVCDWGWGWTAAQHCLPGACSLQQLTEVSFCPAALSARRGKGGLAITTDALGLGSRYSVSTSSTGFPG